MSRQGRLGRAHRLSASLAGWAVIAFTLVFTLSIGTAVHNHGLFGSDGGAEKVSQSSFTCPACVFDGKPVTTFETVAVIADSGTVSLDLAIEHSFERLLEGSTSTRAPPAA